VTIAGNGVIPLDPFSERLASVPQIPRRTIQGDGTEPRGAEPSDETEQQPALPTLVDASDIDAFRTVDQLAKSQDRLRRNRYAIDLYHTWLDSNVQFGRLDKIPNQNVWIAKLAPGVSVERSAAVPNKSADLCNKVTDALLADPPKPNPQPHVDDQAADAAADLASEFLRQLAGESGINEVQQYRWAFRNALTRSTSFLEYDVDADGGGYQPYQVLAHPQAVDANDPLVATDAMGQPAPAVDPILRYVNAQGQFVDEASQADRVWLPKIIVRKHQRTKVLLFPAHAPIEDASAALITDYCTLEEGRKRWPDTVGTMTMEELKALASWKPSMSEMIVPFTFRGGIAEGMTGPSLDEVGSLSPLLQQRMFFYRLYVTKSKEYQSGLILDLSGADGGKRLGQDSMEYTVTLPTHGQTTRCRDIPLVQVTPIQDVADLDPMGWPFEARFDGSAQADATLIAHYLDALERQANPHVFIRSTTSVDEDEWFDRSKPIVIGLQDQPPFYEQFSPLPPVVQVSEHLQTRQDTASGLTATAQGLDTEASQSGIAKRLTVRQAQISLAGMQQQLHSAFTRGWRISCQIAQAKFSTPQLMQFSGEDASNEAQWWTGEDFAGIDDIGIEPGTGTMMTAEDKANYVRFLQDSGWKTPEEAAEIGVTGIARDLGLPSDFTKAAIERAVGVWLKGPPSPEWIQQWQQYQIAKQAYDAAQQQFAQAQQLYAQGMEMRAIAAGGPPQPLGPEQQNAQAMDQYQEAALFLQMHPESQTQPVAPNLPPPQKPWTPFITRPNDTEPSIAAKWAKRLSHLQMTPQYEAQPPEWRACADEKYMAARQAVAIAAGAGGQPQAAPHKPSAAPAKVPGSSQSPGAQAA
jgi:hypothetical protein